MVPWTVGAFEDLVVHVRDGLIEDLPSGQLVVGTLDRRPGAGEGPGHLVGGLSGLDEVVDALLPGRIELTRRHPILEHARVKGAAAHQHLHTLGHQPHPGHPEGSSALGGDGGPQFPKTPPRGVLSSRKSGV